MIRWGICFANCWDAEVKAVFEALNDGGVFMEQAQACEFCGPDAGCIGRCCFKPFPLEGKPGLRGLTFRTQSTCVVRDGAWPGIPWGGSSQNIV